MVDATALDDSAGNSYAGISNTEALSFTTVGGGGFAGTWTERTGSGSRSWWAIDSSADETKLIALDAFNDIYTSSDSGVTWVSSLDGYNKSFFDVTSSTDGTKLAVADSSGGGNVYTSSDS